MLLRYTNAIPQNYKALQRPPKKLYVKFPHLKMKKKNFKPTRIGRDSSVDTGSRYGLDGR
jgi:hypothetical protein